MVGKDRAAQRRWVGEGDGAGGGDVFTCPVFPLGEPIRPIDPAAWVSHTAAMTGTYPAYGMSPSMSTITSTSSSITSSIPETERKSLCLCVSHPCLVSGHLHATLDRRHASTGAKP